MRKWSFASCALLAVCLLLPASISYAQAQSSGTGMTRNTSSRDRLFLSFIEDAMVVEDQWWEGWLQYDDSDSFDRTVLFGRAAFQPWRNVELGGQFGFGNTDTPGGIPDGSGATDLDFWGKYYWRMDNEKTELAAGAVLTIPTGDDTAGLGFDAFALEGFGAIRQRLKVAVITGKVGLRANGDGQIFGVADLMGELSVSLGAGAIIPLSDRFAIIAEIDWENERFQNTDDDGEILGGFSLDVSNRGLVRGALGFGWTDGAPDFQLRIGYAATF